MSASQAAGSTPPRLEFRLGRIELSCEETDLDSRRGLILELADVAGQPIEDLCAAVSQKNQK